MSGSISYVPVDQGDGRPVSPPSINTLQSPKRRSCWGAWVGDGWLYEIASTSMGILYIAALVIILRTYDGQPSPRFGTAFGSALTLNTVTSILSAAAKAALLYPVAQCMGQLKWIWFSKGRRALDDMSVFDRASRGISGGFELMWRTRVGTVAVLGSLLMIYGIAIDPLSQQLVQYSSNGVRSPVNVTIPIVRDWSEPVSIGPQGGMIIGNADLDGGVSSQISLLTKGSILAELYSNTNKTTLDLAPSCSSTNCTFPSYTSLAVCTSFANVSSHVHMQNISTGDEIRPFEVRYAVTNNSYLVPQAFFNASSAFFEQDAEPETGSDWQYLNFNYSIAFKDVRRPLTDFFVIYPKGIEGQHTRPDGVIELGHMTYGALEFVMEWCLQEYSTEVVNGVSTTRRHNSTRVYGNSTLPWDPEIDSSTHSSISRFFNRIFAGSVSLGYDQYWYADTDAAQALFDPYNVWQAHPTDTIFALKYGLRGTNQTGLELIINNMATSMTNSMRSRSSDFANGTMVEQEIVVQVRWRWIASHVVFIFLCLVLLAYTMIATHFSVLRDHRWKVSNSAILHALSPSLQLNAKGISRETQMSSSDREQLVYLRHVEDEGWRLVAHDAKR